MKIELSENEEVILSFKPWSEEYKKNCDARDLLIPGPVEFTAEAENNTWKAVVKFGLLDFIRTQFLGQSKLRDTNCDKNLMRYMMEKSESFTFGVTKHKGKIFWFEQDRTPKQQETYAFWSDKPAKECNKHYYELDKFLGHFTDKTDSPEIKR